MMTAEQARAKFIEIAKANQPKGTDKPALSARQEAIKKLVAEADWSSELIRSLELLSDAPEGAFTKIETHPDPVAGQIFVCLTNPNSHNYPIGMPVFCRVSQADAANRSGSVYVATLTLDGANIKNGNHPPTGRPGAIRLATVEETERLVRAYPDSTVVEIYNLIF
jgi:hypothetical protein